jgi:hypothetical protein
VVWYKVYVKVGDVPVDDQLMDAPVPEMERVRLNGLGMY